MRAVLVVIAVVVLGGCANPRGMQEAADRCAAVGISPRDADFAACTKAYTLESEQASLSTTYQRTIDTPLRPRRFSHCTDIGAC